MEELKKVRSIVDRQADGYVQRVLLVIDGTSGQNAIVQARSFTEAVQCDGVMITKLDGSARGGVALAIAGRPWVAHMVHRHRRIGGRSLRV